MFGLRVNSSVSRSSIRLLCSARFLFLLFIKISLRCSCDRVPSLEAIDWVPCERDGPSRSVSTSPSACCLRRSSFFACAARCRSSKESSILTRGPALAARPLGESTGGEVTVEVRADIRIAGLSCVAPPPLLLRLLLLAGQQFVQLLREPSAVFCIRLSSSWVLFMRLRYFFNS